MCSRPYHRFFFFNDTATTEIYTLSLHDALPISLDLAPPPAKPNKQAEAERLELVHAVQILYALNERPLVIALDRKSTRLNSSHSQISYAVFCLKKKNINYHTPDTRRLAHSA